MSKFDKLTDAEHRRLQQLCKEQQRAQAVIEEDVFWAFAELGEDSMIYADNSEVFDRVLEERKAPHLQTVKANELHIKRWAEAGYVSILPSSVHGGTRFVLTPRGLDYIRYRAHWRIVRWWLDLWHEFRTEIRSALVSAITSIIVSLITAYLVLKLGLK